MILKREFKDFRNWILRTHGRRMLNQIEVDEVVMAMRIREYFEVVKGVRIPEDEFNTKLEALRNDTGNGPANGDPKPNVDGNEDRGHGVSGDAPVFGDGNSERRG